MVKVGDQVRITSKDVDDSSMFVRKIEPDRIIISMYDDIDEGYILEKDARGNWRIQDHHEYAIEFIPTTILSEVELLPYPAMMTTIESFDKEEDFMKFCLISPEIREFCKSHDDIYSTRIKRLSPIAYKTKPKIMTWREYYFSPEIQTLRRMKDHPESVVLLRDGVEFDTTPPLSQEVSVHPTKLTEAMFDNGWFSVIYEAVSRFGKEFLDNIKYKIGTKLFVLGRISAINFIETYDPNFFKIGGVYSSGPVRDSLISRNLDLVKKIFPDQSIPMDEWLLRHVMHSSYEVMNYIENLYGIIITIEEYARMVDLSYDQPSFDVFEEFIKRGYIPDRDHIVKLLRTTSNPKFIDILIGYIKSQKIHLRKTDLTELCTGMRTNVYTFRLLSEMGYTFDSGCLANRMRDIEVVRFFLEDLNVEINQLMIDRAFTGGTLETIAIIQENFGEKIVPSRNTISATFSHSSHLDVVRYLHDEYGFMPTPNNLISQFQREDILRYYVDTLKVVPNSSVTYALVDRYAPKHIVEYLHNHGAKITPAVMKNILKGGSASSDIGRLFNLLDIFNTPEELRVIYDNIPEDMFNSGGFSYREIVKSRAKDLGINL